jgi:general secretion pathway protein B
MSFILDALKKSEQERERQQQPAIVDLPVGRRDRAQPLWLWIVIGLLLINCVLLLVMWWRSSDAPAPVATAPANASSSVAAVTNTPAASLNNSVSRMPAPTPAEVRPLQDEVSDTTAEPEETVAEDSEPASPPLVRPLSGLERAVAQQDAMANRLKTDSLSRGSGLPVQNNIPNAENLPTLDSLGSSGGLNLPPLRLDVHVYSSVPAERFAFINGRKYSEGQALSEGPLVERISQDGVVLSYRNQRFVLPRQ